MILTRNLGIFLFLLVTSVVLFCGCACVRHRSYVGDTIRDSVMFRHWDSDFVEGLNKSERAVVYKLSPLADSVAGSVDVSIAGFRVIGKPYSLSLGQLSVLRFILGNEKFYANEALAVKTLFAPYLAMEVDGGNGKMYLLFAFNTSELALVKDGKIVQKRACARNDLLVQFGLDLFPNDEYLISINK